MATMGDVFFKTLLNVQTFNTHVQGPVTIIARNDPHPDMHYYTPMYNIGILCLILRILLSLSGIFNYFKYSYLN